MFFLSYLFAFNLKFVYNNIRLKFNQFIRKGIEVVITSRTRNAVVDLSAHGFESHPFRQSKKNTLLGVFCFAGWDENL